MRGSPIKGQVRLVLNEQSCHPKGNMIFQKAWNPTTRKPEEQEETEETPPGVAGVLIEGARDAGTWEQVLGVEHGAQHHDDDAEHVQSTSLAVSQPSSCSAPALTAMLATKRQPAQQKRSLSLPTKGSWQCSQRRRLTAT